MTFPITEPRATATVGADGTASVNILTTPPDRIYILSLITTAPQSGGGAGVVKVNGSPVLPMPAISSGIATGIRVQGNLSLDVTNCNPGDLITVVPFGEAWVGRERINAPIPAPSASSAVDFAQQSQVVSGVIAAGVQEITLVIPGPAQRVTVTDAFTDVPADVTRGAPGDTTIQLRDITAGTNATALRRFYAPGAVPASAVGSDPWGMSLAGGTTFPPGHSVGVRLGNILATGDILAVLQFVVV